MQSGRAVRANKVRRVRDAHRLLAAVLDRLEAARAPGRRRFTIAHELGHWVLDRRRGIRPAPTPPIKLMLTDAAGANERLAWMLDYPDEELDANQFAAAILMPEHLLSHARAATTDPKELAERFGASTEALARRQTFLDLLAANSGAVAAATGR
jgi:IrrE N-terminal-like domain